MRKKIDKEKLEAFTERFKEVLMMRGHSDKSLEEIRLVCQINKRGMVHRYLHAESLPSYETGEKICIALKCSYSWLMVGSGTMDDFNLRAPDEVALITQYRNQTKVGKRKIMKMAFTECDNHEIAPITKQDRQTALKIVVKKQP